MIVVFIIVAARYSKPKAWMLLILSCQILWSKIFGTYLQQRSEDITDDMRNAFWIAICGATRKIYTNIIAFSVVISSLMKCVSDNNIGS